MSESNIQPSDPVVDTVSFAEEVWETLSKIDVSDHIEWIEATEKRPAIDYIPWHKAWLLVKRNFPASRYKHEPDLHHSDGTVEVSVDVCIKRDHAAGVEGIVFTNATLAVMDRWMNAIQNPNARQINDSRQRVLVKALAFAGLGLNLWGSDSIPVGELDEPLNESQLETITQLLEKSESNEASFLKWAGVESVADIPQERYHSARNLLEKKISRKQKAKAS